MTLTDFLLARIAEDEEAARVFGLGYALLKGPTGRPLVTTDPLPSVVTYAHVLAECEAKRQIISQCDMLARGPALGAFSEPEAEHARYTLRCLAGPYADHSDYREEWKP